MPYQLHSGEGSCEVGIDMWLTWKATRTMCGWPGAIFHGSLQNTIPELSQAQRVRTELVRRTRRNLLRLESADGVLRRRRPHVRTAPPWWGAIGRIIAYGCRLAARASTTFAGRVSARARRGQERRAGVQCDVQRACERHHMLFTIVFTYITFQVAFFSCCVAASRHMHIVE